MSTQTIEQSGGLFGAARSVTSRINVASLSDPLRWIVRFVLLAGFVLVLKKAKANPDPTDAAVIMLLGCAALMAEYYMGGEMVRGWVERSLIKVFSSLAVYIAVLGYAALQWTGTAAEMETNKTGMQKAAFVTQQDTSKSEAELTKRNNDLLQRIEMAPKRTAEQAEAAIVNAKANRFWNMTNGCTETKGPQTRAFCDAYASAVADKAGAIALITDREDQKQVAKELRALRDGRKNEVVVVSENRSDLRFLTHYANMSEQAAADLSAAWKIVIISFLACILGMMIKAREYRDVPRQPWGVASRLHSIVRWFKAALYGRDAIKGDTYVIDDTAARQAAKAAFARYAGAN